MSGVPPAELDIDEDLVHRLLLDQAPHLADLSLARFLNGWDESVWRLGDDLAVRIPRRELGAPLVEHEQRLLPALAPLLPLPVPAPMVHGRPLAGDYPWSRRVVPWYDGEPAAAHQPPAETATLGRFLVHCMRSRRSTGRRTRSEKDRCRFGSTAGDPRVDLAAAWWLFEPEHHAVVWQAYGGITDDLWLRSCAWAAHVGLMFLGFRPVDDPTQLDEVGVELGRRQLRRRRREHGDPSLTARNSVAS